MRNVLVVDNDYFFVEFLGDFFIERGFEILKAYDGKEGARIFATTDIDLVCVDLIMPKVSGEDFIRWVRKTTRGRAIPIIAVSGALVEQMERTGDIGADFFLAKGPFEAMEKELVKILDRIDGRDEGNCEALRFCIPEKVFPRQTTCELLESVAFQRAIFERIGLGVMVVDRDGVVIQVNGFACEMLGGSLEQFLSLKVYELFPGEYRPTLLECMRAVIGAADGETASFKGMLGELRVQVTIALNRLETGAAGWVVTLDPIGL